MAHLEGVYGKRIPELAEKGDKDAIKLLRELPSMGTDSASNEKATNLAHSIMAKYYRTTSQETKEKKIKDASEWLRALGNYEDEDNVKELLAGNGISSEKIQSVYSWLKNQHDTKEEIFSQLSGLVGKELALASFIIYKYLENPNEYKGNYESFIEYHLQKITDKAIDSGKVKTWTTKEGQEDRKDFYNKTLTPTEKKILELLPKYGYDVKKSQENDKNDKKEEPFNENSVK